MRRPPFVADGVALGAIDWIVATDARTATAARTARARVSSRVAKRMSLCAVSAHAKRDGKRNSGVRTTACRRSSARMRASSLRVTRIVDDPSLGAGTKPWIFQQPARSQPGREGSLMAEIVWTCPGCGKVLKNDEQYSLVAIVQGAEVRAHPGTWAIGLSLMLSEAVCWVIAHLRRIRWF